MWSHTGSDESVIGKYVKTIETLPPWLKVGASPCGARSHCSPRKFWKWKLRKKESVAVVSIFHKEACNTLNPVTGSAYDFYSSISIAGTRFGRFSWLTKPLPLDSLIVQRVRVVLHCIARSWVFRTLGGLFVHNSFIYFYSNTWIHGLISFFSLVRLKNGILKHFPNHVALICSFLLSLLWADVSKIADALFNTLSG